MGMAVIFVMTMASVVTWAIYRYILVRYKIQYLETIVYILVIATLVQLVEMAIQKFSESLYEALGIYLPLITTNCAVLGVALLNIKNFGMIESTFESFAKSLVQGVGAGLGFMLAMLLMSGIRERLETADVPEAFQGVPIAFVCAGLMALAFIGFGGLG